MKWSGDLAGIVVFSNTLPGRMLLQYFLPLFCTERQYLKQKDNL